MASNVFGTPITTETLVAMPEYARKEITRKDRAHVALLWKHDHGKDINVRKYVENLKAEWGTGICVECVVYNATGDTLSYATDHDFHGHIGPAPYPTDIANGQWGGFLHVKHTGTASGSAAGIVYRGLNEAGETCDWMLSWSNPWIGSNRAYTEIRQKDHSNGSWDTIYRLLENSGSYHKDNWNGCFSEAVIGTGTTAVFEATMSQSDAA